MDPKIINGREVARQIFQKLKDDVSKLDIKPCINVFLVGNDPASSIYVNMKKRRCDENGFNSIITKLPEDISQKELIEHIKKSNENKKINGILVQVPLPKHISEEAVIEAVSPDKDVDCFHPYNLGRLIAGNPVFLPCTPAGVVVLLDYYGIHIHEKRAVVVGRSNIVGKPLSILLLARHATTTICHSRTANIEEETKKADILVAAVGKPNFITADMVKPGAVVIDVGINRVDDPTSERGYKIVGDVDYDSVLNKCEYITPVPGGVGAMTIAMLLENTFRAYNLQNNNG